MVPEVDNRDRGRMGQVLEKQRADPHKRWRNCLNTSRYKIQYGFLTFVRISACLRVTYVTLELGMNVYMCCGGEGGSVEKEKGHILLWVIIVIVKISYYG